MPSPLILHHHRQHLLEKLASQHLLKFPLQQQQPARHRCSLVRNSLHRTRNTFATQAVTSSHPLSPRNTPRKPKLQLQPNYLTCYPALETQKACLSTWTTAVVIALAGVLALTLSSSHTPAPEPQQDETSPSSTTTENWESKMTGEVQPGRPGTLTAEQEEKLRQFWIAASKVFGIIDDKFIDELSAKTNGIVASETKEKLQKKRFGVFSRKHKNTDSDADSTASADTDHKRTPSAAQDDDKYGQTKQFYETISKQSPESLRQTSWSMIKHDHPDALLLRFLRARRWDVDKALIMMISTMNWRATDAHIDDDVMLNGEEGAVHDAETKNEERIKVGSGEDFMAQLRMGKSFFHGHDRLDRPICYVRARLHKAGDHSPISLERATSFQIETARMMLAPPVDTATVVFDLTGFSLANMDYAPVKFMIKCFEANYPESLGVVLVHRAPWVFQGVWKIIKGWLDPVVASKVHFTNDVSDLEQFITKDKLPKTFGGDEEWEYKYLEPVKGENDRMKDEETRDKLLGERQEMYKRYQDATLEWIRAAAKGEDTKDIKVRRNQIAEELRVGYWRLDPYIRARSFYDRSGVLKEGGTLDFYPKTTEGHPTIQGVDEKTTTVPVEETKVSGEALLSPASAKTFVTANEEGESAKAEALAGDVEKVKLNGHTETSEADLD